MLAAASSDARGTKLQMDASDERHGLDLATGAKVRLLHLVSSVGKPLHLQRPNYINPEPEPIGPLATTLSTCFALTPPPLSRHD